MTNIYNKAYEYITENKHLLDLYCGTGTIGIWLNNKFDSVTGVEINESSIKNANINKELNNLKNIKFICNDAKNIEGKFDSIVVDPPRIGLSKDVINYLNNSNSKEIIYISCNPNTLKRDLDLLTNYVVKDISCADMFPRTKHIESLMVLERKN
jgi:23S rRNA (uracil1939-C5)-methyltransferase